MIAATRGKNTFTLAADYRTMTSGQAPPERRFRVSGLFNLSGFKFNQLSGQHYGRLVGQFRRVFWDAGFADLSYGTSLEYGNVWESPSEIGFDQGIFAGSIFVGANSPIGPLYLGYDLAEDGASSFYLYIGALRSNPALQ
jgi:NTE family protein